MNLVDRYVKKAFLITGRQSMKAPIMFFTDSENPELREGALMFDIENNRMLLFHDGRWLHLVAHEN